MPREYHQLLGATIQHLEGLRDRGVRFISVSPSTLTALAQKPSKPALRTRPAQGSAASPVDKSTSGSAAAASAIQKGTAASIVGQTAVSSESQPVVAGISSEAKRAAFDELRQRAMACTKCSHLAAARKSVVFGVGSLDAALMFVGEAPGADEDEQAEPFVGKAGQLLTKIIQTMGLSRNSVYIANILKCRPDTPGQASGNRKPTPEEMQTCIPYLHEQIDLIGPKVIVALGGTAVEGLLGKTIGITRLRGQWRTYRGIPLMPTYHPAYLLRNQAPSEKRRVWEDMLQVMERLGLDITEKQRNYFL